MKETYVEAEMEIIEFESEDVIRTSSGTSGPPETPFVPFGENGE